MRVSKLASVLFAVLGTVLLVGAIVCCFWALGRPDKAIEPAEAADVCARSVLSALDCGDFAAVERQLYGKPSLGFDREPATAEGKLLWDAYRDSIVVTADEACYAVGTDIFQTAQITALDIEQTLSELDRRAQVRLQQELEAQEDPFALLEENGQIPQALKDSIRMQALQDVLAQPVKGNTQISFQLIEKDGRWWVLPDSAMMDVLSGGIN